MTDAESAGRWRELLGGAGVQRASLTGAGIFKDQASDALVRTASFGMCIDEILMVLAALPSDFSQHFKVVACGLRRDAGALHVHELLIIPAILLPQHAVGM